MISIGLLFFLVVLNNLMCEFLFNTKNTMYKLLGYTKIHAIFINLRTLLLLMLPILEFNAELPYMRIVVDLMTAFWF